MNEKKAGKIAGDWDDDKCWPLRVIRYQDGRLSVADGQHRHHAAVVAQRESIPIWWRDGTPEDAARIFRTQNDNMTRVSAIHFILAGISQGDPEMLDLRDVVQKHGYELTVSRSRNGIDVSCGDALLKIFRQRSGADNLDRALGLVRGCWGTHPDTANHFVIRGMVEFLRRHGNQAKDREVLRKLHGIDTEELLGERARRAAFVRGARLNTSQNYLYVADAIEDAYNWKRTSGRLHSPLQAPPLDSAEAQP